VAQFRPKEQFIISGLVNFKFDSLESETHTFPLSQGAVLKGFRSTAGFIEHSAAFAIEGAAVSNALRVYKYSTGFSHSIAKPLPQGAVISQGYHFGLVFLQYYNCGYPGWQAPGTTPSAFASIAAMAGNMAGCGSSGAVARITKI
jgi:hypothetical protein